LVAAGRFYQISGAGETGPPRAATADAEMG